MVYFTYLGIVLPNKKDNNREIFFPKLKEAQMMRQKTKCRPLALQTRIVTLLEDYLGNFEHIETGKSLDSKM